jgi:hypothetical protein
MFMMNGKTAKWSAICTGDDLAQSVDQKICEKRCFKISELLCEFPKFHTLFFMRLPQSSSAITSLRKMGSKNAHRCEQHAQNGFSFDF